MDIEEKFITALIQARNRAIKENIRANTAVIDKRFAIVHGFIFEDLSGDALEFPPMIAGMKVMFDDLPDENAAFYVLRAEHTPESKMEKLERENKELREKLEGVRELVEKYW